MKPFARKEYLTLPKPSADDPLDDRARLLQALGPETVHMTLAAMQALYPALRADDYRVTATLSPAEHGWTVVRVEPGDTTARFFALALDIGTTTLEMELLHLPDGEALSRAGCFNGQCALGDNILDRIFYAKDNAAHLHELQTLLLGSIRSLISACCERAAVLPEEIAVLGIGGNTTMIHLLLGCEPWQVFQSPYTPVFLDPGIVPASELALPLCCNVFCMPAVANYLGGDITAGLLMTDMDTRPDLAVFLDVGTNGELALGCRDYLLTGAGAAGPALEGAVSRSGMRAEPGAVCRVRIGADNRLRCETIGGALRHRRSDRRGLSCRLDLRRRDARPGRIAPDSDRVGGKKRAQRPCHCLRHVAERAAFVHAGRHCRVCPLQGGGVYDGADAHGGGRRVA